MLLLFPSLRMTRRAHCCQTPFTDSVKLGELILVGTLEKVFSGFFSNHFSNPVSALTTPTGKEVKGATVHLPFIPHVKGLGAAFTQTNTKLK